jgi:hypothetical protein
VKPRGRWLAVFLAGALTARALTVGAGPPIRLRPYARRLDRAPESVIGELREQLANAPNVLVQSGNSFVASFAGRAGALRYRTTELIRFSDRQVTFEHLSGPFRSAQESFDLVSLRDGATALEHRGQFVMRYGLLGWTIGRLIIRRMFEGLVAAHMARLADAATARPARQQ